MCEVRLHQPFAGTQGIAVGLEEYLFRGRPAPEPRRIKRRRRQRLRRDREAIARQRNRGRHQIGQREAAGTVFLFCKRETGDGARDPDAERGIARFLRIGIALCVEERFAVDGLRRGFAIIDRGVAAVGEMDDHEAAAADIAGARIGHRHRKADGDRGIDRIAAFLQNVDADARRRCFLRHHHPVGRDGLPGLTGGILSEGREGRRQEPDQSQPDQ